MANQTNQLTSSLLDSVAPDIGVPAYDRSSLRRSIVHIGVGGFHRAHFATYVDELCRAGHTDWAIVGAGVLPGDELMATILRDQDHLYSLITRGADTTDVRIIGSIVEFIHAVPDPEPLIARIADPETQIVSLTVTEGGYPVDDATGEYRPTASTAGPGSAFGLIVRALDRRRVDGGGPLTVLSCDNVLGNGDTTRTATLGAAAEHEGLSDWIEANVSFPNSMVDRITPSTGDSDREWLRDHHGVHDGWPVVTEPFRQWVVEDRFAGDRLPLEDLDAIVTDDVEPYEMMKLHLLNAGHSCLAYLSALLQVPTVDQALADESIRNYVTEFLTSEARPVTAPVHGVDLDEYVRSLIERFSNPNIGDQIARLCLDGSAKFPKFLLPTVHAQLDRDGQVRLAALAIAGWCEYLRLGSEEGSDIEVSPDPQLERATECARASVDDPAKFLQFDSVFGDRLASGRFADEFVAALRAIRERGVRSAIDAALT